MLIFYPLFLIILLAATTSLLVRFRSKKKMNWKQMSASQIGVVLALLFISILIIITASRNKEDKFEKITGLNISDSVVSIKKTDTYFPFEGEYSLVFKTTKKQIEKWINGKPPWDNRIWNKGQIPFDIGMSVQFNFKEGIGVASNQDHYCPVQFKIKFPDC